MREPIRTRVESFALIEDMVYAVFHAVDLIRPDEASILMAERLEYAAKVMREKAMQPEAER